MRQNYHIRVPEPIDLTPTLRFRELLAPAMNRPATTAATKSALAR